MEKNKYKSKFTNQTENYIEDHKIFEEEYMRYEAIVDNFIEETVSYIFFQIKNFIYSYLSKAIK